MGSENVFTPEEVHSLNDYQNSGVMHPFTCGSGHRTEHPDGEGILVATTKGWVCPYCDFRQDWAHVWMTDGAWKKNGSFEIIQLLHERARRFAELDEEMARALQSLFAAFAAASAVARTEKEAEALIAAGKVLAKLREYGLLPEGKDDNRS